MTSKRRAQICALLKAIETGDEAAVAVVNPDKYIQHNPQTDTGGEGLAALFKRLSKSSPRVNIVRVFSDGDYVFGHTEYDFSTRRIGFEVFRFEGAQTVEHWDNIQPRQGPNPSAHSMVDGETKVTDLEKTEANRALVRSFTDDVLIGGQLQQLANYVSEATYTEHNALRSDGIASLRVALSDETTRDEMSRRYTRRHKLLAQGNFVLAACEGYRGKVHCAIYDLYRVADGRIVEHWDTVEAIAPRSEWKNQNGKF